MIRIDGLKLTLGGKELFNDLFWSIPSGSRWGLIGANGTGKTTLLKTITKEVFPDSGTVEIPPQKTIGYLPQDFVELEDMPVISFLRKHYGLEDLESSLRHLEERIASGNDEKRTLHAYERQRERFENMQGYSFEAEAGRILAGLGFSTSDAERSCSEFSGGWKMRIYLAALLLEGPDILLLDEPTNHLDLESVQWVEHYLVSTSNTVIAISHDRHFLDTVTEQTAELSEGRVETFKGGYSAYLEERVRREEITQRTAKKQERRRDEIMSFVERFRYKASKASQVQSRLKQLEKETTIRVRDDQKKPSIHFPPCPRSGLEVAQCKNLGKAYKDKKVFTGVDMEIRRGEKIALVGVNGAGKSTLARIIAGLETPTEGVVRYGHKVKKAFFSQESESNLSMDKTVWQEIRSVPSSASDAERRNLLGAFLFEGEEIEKPVNILSGGEKSRLALLKLLLTDSNFLILDEPTNHLDITTREILLLALRGWNGTALIISHDRWFLDETVQRVVEIRHGTCRQYPGNVSEYLKKREAEDRNSPEQQKPSGNGGGGNSEKAKKRLEAARRNERYRMRRKVLDDLKPLEEKISRSETRLDEIDEKLCRPDVLQNSDLVKDLMVERDTISRNVEDLFGNWETLMERLEEIDRDFYEHLQD
ncbi:MAG: ABC-F family ATP-binding cassette domain-containing protein [Thermovirgaceae bacterium]